MKRVVLLCGSGLSSRLVAQSLAQAGCLVSIIEAGKKGIIETLSWRIRRHGLLSVISQLMSTVVARIFFYIKGGLNRQKEILAEIGLKEEWPEHILKIRVSNVNDRSCIEALKSANPDVVVINGTDVIRKNVLDSIKSPFVNIHCGLTPDYRGVHGAFWAIWQGRSDRVGVTVHLVDAGVDTGKVIAQANVSYNKEKDGFLVFPLLQYQKAIPLLINYINSGASPGPLPGSIESRQWYHPGIRAYLHLLIRGDISY